MDSWDSVLIGELWVYKKPCLKGRGGVSVRKHLRLCLVLVCMRAGCMSVCVRARACAHPSMNMHTYAYMNLLKMLY